MKEKRLELETEEKHLENKEMEKKHLEKVAKLQCEKMVAQVELASL